MRITATVTGLLLLAGVAVAATLSAPDSSEQATKLTPEPRQVLIARTVVEVMHNRHYPEMELNEELAHVVLEQYFDALDPGRFYFTRPAIERFHKYDASLADDLRHGNLEPAFEIYRYYIEQARERLHYALDLLVEKPEFESAASFRFSRRHAPWAKNEAALDRLWRERVKNDVLSLLLAGNGWKEAKKTLTDRYRYALNHVNQTTSNDVFDTFMNAYAQAGDPHSSYFSPFDAEQFQLAMSLQFEGIGAQLTIRDNHVTVVRILPGGPAAKSDGLKAGDRIVGVDQGKDDKMVDVIGWRLDDVVKMIRGPKGSAVRLRILPAGALPGGAEKTLTLVRDTIELSARHAHARVVLVRRGTLAYKIGIIAIPSFYVNFQAEGNGKKHYTSVSRDVRDLIGILKRKEVTGILLDLRNNGGGSLQEARKLTGLFIPGGPVVQVQERGGHTQSLFTPRGEKQAWHGPLAVLVNRFSASATEIFAGALQDYRRALILGSRTWGKGTVQQLVKLGRYLPGFKAGELKLTTAQFFRVNGSSTQHRGVEPDIVIPNAVNEDEFGESSYPNALPWKRIAAADYTPVNTGLRTVLPKIKDYYKSVVREQPRFQLYLRQIHASLAEASRTRISLNLEKRKAERAARRAHALALDNAWRKLLGKPPFDTLEAANDADFDTPDVPLQAGASLLGEYIDLRPSIAVNFEIHAIHLPQTQKIVTCLRQILPLLMTKGCADVNGGEGKIIYPPSARTAGAGGG